MNRPSVPTPNQPPSGRPAPAAPARPGASGGVPAGSVIAGLPGAGPVALPDGPPAELAGMLPPGNVVILGGPGSGKTALLEATMHRLLADPGGTARFLTSSRQGAVASTERLLAALGGASGGALGCVTWYAFARGLVTSHADLLDYRGEPRPLSGPEQWSLVRSLLTLDQAEVDWGPLAPLVDTRAFTDELAEFVLACERRLVDPEELLERATTEARPNWVPVAAFLTLYGEHLALQDSVDQAGLILQAGDLLEDHPDVLAATVAQVGTILVDEAQELDPAQRRLLTLLVEGGARAILAGDPAGATDTFRGATPGALPALARTSPPAWSCSSAAGGSAVPGSTPCGASRQPGPARSSPSRRRDHDGGGRPLPRPGRGGGGERPPAPGRPRTGRRPLRPDGHPAAVDPAAQRTHPPGPGAVRRPVPAGRGRAPAGGRAGRRARPRPVPPRPRPGPRRRAASHPPHLPLGGLDPGELRALRRAALLADRSLADHVRARAVPPPPPDPDPGPPGPRRPPREAAGPGGRWWGEVGPARTGSALVLDPGLVARVQALCDLLERAEGWVAELDADACFWEVWRTAPAFSELILRAEVDPTDADVQRQLDALTAFSRALSLFVDGRPGASMRTYLDVVERADFASDPWLPPGMTRNDAVAVLSVNAAKGQEFDLVVVAGCLEGALPMTARPQGLFEAWRLDGDPGPVARANELLDAERRRFTLAASRARDRVVFTASRVDGRGEPSRFLRELGLELPADPRPGDGPARVPGGGRRPAPGGRRPGPAGGRTAGRRDHPGRHRWRRPGHLVVAPGLHRRPRADRRRGAPAHLLLPDRDLRGLPPEVLLRQRGRARRPLLLPDGLRPAHAHHLRAGRQGRHRQRARRPEGRLPAAVQPRLVPVQGHRLPVLARRHGHAGAVAPQRGRGRPPRPAVRGRVRDGGRGHLVRGRIDRVDPGPDDGIVLLDYKTARYPASEEEAERSLQLAIYYLAALRDPELAALGHPVEMQLVYPARVMHGRFTRVSQHPGPDHASQVERRLLALLDGAAAESFDPDPHADCRMCAFKPICPMWPQGEEFLAPAHPPAGLGPGGAPAAEPGRNGGGNDERDPHRRGDPGGPGGAAGPGPDPEQLAAITAPIGPVHVIAAPGRARPR